MQFFQNYINGNFSEPVSGKYFKYINPADKTDVIGEFPLSDKEDVDNTVENAKDAFKKWKMMPAPKREDILRKAGDEFTRRKKELAEIMTREMVTEKEAGLCSTFSLNGKRFM